MKNSKKWDSRKKAAEFGIDPKFVAAIIKVESSGDPSAVRFEPKWRYVLTPEKWAKKNAITVETERVLQSMSFGLMQIMGTKMRELGYDGPLSEAVDHDISGHYACKFLKQLFDKWQDPRMVAAAYNGGSPIMDPKTRLFRNEGYVVKVMKNYKGV